MTKKVAVIGAGISGLAAIKCCLDEGLQPVCYEQRDGFGGLWNYNPGSLVAGQSTVMENTLTNTGKEMYCYSDFPFPQEFPYYLTSSTLMTYLRMYAENFKLLDCIEYNTEVVDITQSANFMETGRWKIGVKSTKTGETSIKEFDGVLVCNGHHSIPNMPAFEGMESFRGIQMHSQEFLEAKKFKDKHVVVVGMSNSSCDVAVELCHIASKVELSTKSGAWVFPRLIQGGHPTDLMIIRRVFGDLPVCLHEWISRLIANSSFDHSLFNIKPNHKVVYQHLLINDHIQYDIASGHIVVKPNIERITESDVIFKDGSVARDVDAIIYATGYDVVFPFLRQKDFEVPGSRLNLYKNVFPPNIKPGTLGIIGCVEATGPGVPVAEIQARWAARILSGSLELPSQEDMWKDIEKYNRDLDEFFSHSKRYKIMRHWLPYLDEIARLIDCRPNIGRMLITDPKLALATYFGPCIPAQYRLRGRGAWSGAKEHILSTWDRVAYPMQTRVEKGSNGRSESWIFCRAIIYLTVLTIFIWFMFRV